MSKPISPWQRPVSDRSISATFPTFGGDAYTTLGDTLLFEALARSNRERIPRVPELAGNKVVHAKAAGARDEFEVINDIGTLTSAKFLNSVGKRTPVLFSLSATGDEKGSADTVCDVRGFSVKVLYGEWQP